MSTIEFRRPEDPRIHALLLVEQGREPETIVRRCGNGTVSFFLCRERLEDIAAVLPELLELEGRIKAGEYALPCGEERTLIFRRNLKQ